MAAPSPSALRFFPGDHPAVLGTARARIEQRRKEFIEALAGGFAKEFADYKQRVGEIIGLNIALELLDEAEQEMRDK